MLPFKFKFKINASGTEILSAEEKIMKNNTQKVKIKKNWKIRVVISTKLQINLRNLINIKF
tara:strand:+ start:25226 stop:25408 length:183 start_codon:yes stop_codon:yes gene_type:complete